MYGVVISLMLSVLQTASRNPCVETLVLDVIDILHIESSDIKNPKAPN